MSYRRNNVSPAGPILNFLLYFHCKVAAHSNSVCNHSLKCPYIQDLSRNFYIPTYLTLSVLYAQFRENGRHRTMNKVQKFIKNLSTIWRKLLQRSGIWKSVEFNRNFNSKIFAAFTANGLRLCLKMLI